VDIENRFKIDQSLPDTLPPDPMTLFAEWFEMANADRVQPNPDAMTIATSTPDGRPSARVLLCRKIVADPGFIVFYTNRKSRKGDELGANPRAAAVFHWDTLDRQVRIEGPVTLSPDWESDEYFSHRRWESRVGAWASKQSQPLESREDLLIQAAEVVGRLGIDVDKPEEADIPRPPYWGGYRIWAENVELWLGHPARIHDRARWTRTLRPNGDEFTPAAWESTRLQP
jgi:pyridoxamine 5'-phosphate oxidase